MPAVLNLLTALGWSLLDSVWQMAVLWTVYHVLTTGNQRISSAGKYNLVLLFVVFSVEWFGYSFYHLMRAPVIVSSGFLPVSPMAVQWVPYLGGIYLVILIFRFLQFGFQYAGRNAHQFPLSVSPLLQSFTDRYIRILGITKPVTVYLSEMALTAETSGFFKPLILLPASLFTQLSQEQVEAILIHELYHIRRNDYLINVCISAFRSIFFFNPFARLFYKALERERELACDDGVLELGYEPAVYADALYSLERYRQVDPGFSLAADGNRPWLLMDRIRRVLGEPARKEKRFTPMLLTGLAAAFVFFGLQFTAPPTGNTGSNQKNDPVVPIHFEVAEERSNSPVLENSHRDLSTRRIPKSSKSALTKHQTVQRKQSYTIQVNSSPEETPAPDLAYYIDNRAVRNFSNESAAGPRTAVSPIAQGTPYIPSSSFSYETLPQSRAEDSVQQLWVENSLQDIEMVNRIHVNIALNKILKELNNSSQELEETVVKNQKTIILDKKHVFPLLKKVHEEIRLKKKELEKLQIQLQESPQEIIHI